MHGPFPDFDELYGDESVRALAYEAARVEGTGYGRWSRVQEVAELAERMGYRRIGIAYCVDNREEADLAAGCFRQLGFGVVLPGTEDAHSPVDQAYLFRARACDLNVIVGMCVGHDALFLRHSHQPVTSLVVRDARLHHNPAAALYTRTGYLKGALYRPPEEEATHAPPAFSGWSDELLDRLALEVKEASRRRTPPACRVEEIMDFARRAGVNHLGLVYCSGFREEARHLSAILGTNGFRLSSVCCKSGALPKERLGIEDADKVHPGQANPVAQAVLLEREGPDLMLLMGQCVGHDAATVAHLSTPAVFVVAKDRVLAHNTAAALYGSHVFHPPGGNVEAWRGDEP
jgi:uncharacterized metal-binding protein